MEIKSFKQFLSETDIPYKKLKELKEYFLINDIYVTETLDSSYNIIESRIEGVARVYLVQTESKKYYKIYVEPTTDNGKTYIDAGFLRYLGEKGKGKWTALGIVNDLTSTELLRLFGTLKKIALTYDPEIIFIQTNDEPSKLLKYKKILNRIDIPGYVLINDDEGDFYLTKNYKDDKSSRDISFKYKNKFKFKGSK